jgi:hypothetical protein
MTSVHEQDGHQRAEIARRYTVSAEAWLRKLVHDELFSRDGPEYITAGDWNAALKRYVAAKCHGVPGKYTRQIDATTFDQLIDMTCNPYHWPKWSDALREAYPDGVEEARTFLRRLRDIRNDVSHGPICSSRQLEQAVCYTNDLADSIKAHFRKKGMDREFNVPTFVSCSDNVGNIGYLPPGPHYRIVNFSTGLSRALFPGDTLIAEVEVDPSFDESGYDVTWWVKTSTDKGVGTKTIINIETRHVGERMELQFKLITHLEWHRGNACDDVLDLHYKVLPPLT